MWTGQECSHFPAAWALQYPCQTGPAAPTAPFCPQNAADSGPSRAWPCPAQGGSTDPDTPTDSRPENTLVKGYARYLATSLKGTAEIDWDQPTAREAFLAEIGADADRLLAAARDAQDGCVADSPARGQIVAAAQLLSQFLHQDVAGPAAGVRLKQGGEPGPHRFCT